jgi:hypothetical protein
MVLLVLSMLGGAVTHLVLVRRDVQTERFRMLQGVVASLGLSDLALSTEARYTRHPAISDRVVVSMDHPGAIDHFPSTFFWAPVR